jgi:hypothetical protein
VLLKYWFNTLPRGSGWPIHFIKFLEIFIHFLV